MFTEHRDENNNLVGYIRDRDQMHIALDNAALQEVINWIDDGGTPTPDPKALAKVKKRKRLEYAMEARGRIADQVSEWDSLEKIKLVASIWNMLGTPNASQTLARDIYIYLTGTAIPNVNAQVDIASVLAIDPLTDPNWSS